MNKKYLLGFIGILVFTIWVSSAYAIIEGDGGGECSIGDTQSCQITVQGTTYDGTQSCKPNGTWGPCKVSCNVNFSFTPSTVLVGNQFVRAWSSTNVTHLSGTCDNEDGSHYDFPDLPLNWTQTFTAQAGQGTTCTLNGVSPTNNTCTKTATLTVTTPPCVANASWNPSSVQSGNSSNLSWGVTGIFDVVKLFCDSSSLGEVSANGTRTFNNLLANKTCVVKGYIERENPGGGTSLVQKCSSPNVTVAVAPPGPVCTPGQTRPCSVGDQSGTQTCTSNSEWGACVVSSHSISVGFSPVAGIDWAISGPASYSGSGNQTISGVPDGTYSLSITGGWAGRVVTGIVQAISGNSFNFTVNNRAAQTNKGTLTVSQTTLNDNQVQHIEGNANDAADGGKTLILSKSFTRLSNGQQQQGNPSYGWNGIVTNPSGAFSADSTYRCVGTDPTSFNDGDYTNVSKVTYDQGDHTGDTSPSVTETKLCGTSIGFGSQDTNGNPIPIDWSLSGPYSTWNPSQSRVTKPATATYSMRVDEGAYTLSVAPPTGYEFYRFAARPRHLAGTGFVPVCNSLPCNFVADRTHPYSFSIEWMPVGSGQQISCSPASQTVQAGRPASLSAAGSDFAYSWSAPEGSPSSGSGANFSTTYTSPGQKVVTVSSQGSNPKSCLVDVTPGDTPSPAVDLKINNSDGTIQLQPGQSATLRWTTKDVNSCAASGNGWSGAKSAVGGTESKTFDLEGAYSFTITCHNNALNKNVLDTVRANVSAAINQLQVNLVANPNSGDAPLNSTLTATVSGETGSINYNFWWNCNSAATTFAGAVADCGNPLSPSVGAKFDALLSEIKDVLHTYEFPGSYVAKVVAERGSSSAENRATVTVTGQPPFHLECVSTTCAKVSGAGANTCSSEGLSCGGFHYECQANTCSRVNTPGANTDGCNASNVGATCTPGGGDGNSHYGCVSNTCAKINTPGANTDGCNSGNIGATCTPGDGGGGGPGSCTFNASPSLISKGGSAVLSWSSCGNVCSIAGVGGGFSGTGSTRVNPTLNTIYTLNCDNGATVKTAKVSILGLQEDNPQ